MVRPGGWRARPGRRRPRGRRSRDLGSPDATGWLDASGYWREATSVDEQTDLHARLHGLTDLLTPWAIRTAVTVGLPDLLDGGHDDTAALATLAGADPVTLRSLLRHLVAVGICGDILYEIDPVGGALAYGTVLSVPFAAELLAEDIATALDGEG